MERRVFLMGLIGAVGVLAGQNMASASPLTTPPQPAGPEPAKAPEVAKATKAALDEAPKEHSQFFVRRRRFVVRRRVIVRRRIVRRRIIVRRRRRW